MSAEIKREIELKIAHVLFIDIVAYSKMASDDQRAAIEKLNQIVQSTDEFRKAESDNRLLKLATGDGMALIFYDSPEAPVECALEISRALKEHHPQLAHRGGPRAVQTLAASPVSSWRMRSETRRKDRHRKSFHC